MLYSMTGYGQAEASDGQNSFRVEIRSYNHRYLDLQIRLSKELNPIEDLIRTYIKNNLSRGRVEVNIYREDLTDRPRRIRLDKGLYLGYRAALEEMGQLSGGEKPLQVEHFLGFPDLFIIEESAIDGQSLWPTLEGALGKCLGQVVAMRAKEGEELKKDILDKLEAFQGCYDQLKGLAPRVPLEHGQRLRKRLEEMLPEGIPVDAERLTTEIALFADRCDISEELARIQSHLLQFREELAAGGRIGRKLD
ncbi:MAG: YicC family protein, partial [Limnochordia bacterium]